MPMPQVKLLGSPGLAPGLPPGLPHSLSLRESLGLGFDASIHSEMADSFSPFHANDPLE